MPGMIWDEFRVFRFWTHSFAPLFGRIRRMKTRRQDGDDYMIEIRWVEWKPNTVDIFPSCDMALRPRETPFPRLVLKTNMPNSNALKCSKEPLHLFITVYSTQPD
jgi:hypothetical protein